MAITKRIERQSVKTAFVDIALADLVTAEESGVVIDIQPNTVILSGRTVTTEAWDSTTSDVLTVGDTGDDDRYLTDGNIRAAGAIVALVPTGYVSKGEGLTVTWTSGGGTPTTGKVRLEIQYYIQNRGESTVG